jgi:phosphoribosylanthranilate isomerase
VVVGHEPVDDIVRAAMAAGADIVQLHGDPSPRMVLDLRERWPGGIWAVLRVPPDAFDAERAAALFAVSDGVVLDAFVPGALGGTGTTIDWKTLRAPLAAVRAADEASAVLVLAGGLTPENVAMGIRLLSPDVVDVSSGVEQSPGIKDHARMRRFIAAARGERGDDEQLSLAGVQ